MATDGINELDLGQTIRGFAAGQRLFDRYALKEILGRGGMGIVWRAFDEQLERDVALKFLPELVAFDETAGADLKRETKKSQELRHHHIVQVYDFVANKQNACISMEYVDGPTLSAFKARKERGFLEVDEIKGWIEQLCEALTYAHERAHIVHRDLKPANLMINSKAELKVTDFGIARSVSDSVSMLTMARGGTSGTLGYMSPQQLRGERPTYSDDIYSVGTCIFELLTGKPPFYTGDVTDQIKNATPVSMQKRREQFELSGKNIPNQWETTIAACLAKDPAQRPTNARDLAARLGIDVPAVPKSGASVTAPVSTAPLARSRTAVYVATGLAALLVCGIVAVWWLGFQQPRQRAEQERRVEEEKQAKAADNQKTFDEKVKAAAAAQLAGEKRKADEAAAAEAKKKEEEAKQITTSASKDHP